MAKSVIDKEPKAKALYHAGKSLEQIKAKTGISKTTLIAWKTKYNWGEKGQALPELERKESAKLESEAEKHGITKARVFAKIAELIDAKSLAVITTQGAVSLAPMLPSAKVADGKGDFMGIQYDVVPDRKTQIEATKIAVDTLSMKKIQVDPSDEFRSFFSGLKGDK
jgi:Putative ATPase subunit of terminase (gpP-like)